MRARNPVARAPGAAASDAAWTPDLGDVLDRLRDPVWIFDPGRGRVVWANRAALVLWNVPDLATLRTRDYLPTMSDATRARNAAFLVAFREGRTVTEQWTFYPDDVPRTLRCRFSGYPLPDGTTAMLIEGSPVDPALVEPETVRGVEALRHTAVMVTLFDRAGAPLFQNPAAQRAFGLLSARGPFVDLFADAAEGAAALTAVLAGTVFSAETRVVTRDGLRWHGLDARLTQDPATGAPAIMVNQRDVTDRKAADEALRHACERAEHASRVKSEFLANMSHEVRTPMNGVLGMTDLALGTALTGEQRGYLEVVKSSAETLLAVLNDILHLSKLEAGRVCLEHTDFDLRACLDDACRLLAVRAHEKGLELVCDVDDDVPAAVVGDPTRLRQVLLNLLSNAIKFTARGEVVLAATLVGAAEGEATICFAVRDTGIGIPADKRETIFEAFAQADATTTRRYGGTGLGLTIARQLVALMGGALAVRSVVGAGSTFDFTLRLGLAPPRVALDADTEDLRGVRALVVDDHPACRKILRSWLAAWALRPTPVDSGAAALSALRAAAHAGDPFGLVLLDVTLPEMDGFSVAEAIRGDPTLAGTTVVMLSPMDLADRVRRLQGIGVAGWAIKPLRRAELLAVLRARPGVATACAPAPLPEPLPVSRRVLLAEDNAVNRRVAATILQKRGHDVVCAADGREALAALARERFDVVLMDVQMPEMDGLEAVRHLRAREARGGHRTPVLALTAHSLEGDEARFLAAGMDGYVAKPIAAAALLAAVERLCGAG